MARIEGNHCSVASCVLFIESFHLSWTWGWGWGLRLCFPDSSLWKSLRNIPSFQILHSTFCFLFWVFLFMITPVRLIFLVFYLIWYFANLSSVVWQMNMALDSMNPHSLFRKVTKKRIMLIKFKYTDQSVYEPQKKKAFTSNLCLLIIKSPIIQRTGERERDWPTNSQIFCAR